MQNTKCFLSCNNDINGFCSPDEMTRRISILGKQVTVKNYICSCDGINYRKKPENIQMQLFVCPTSYCPAACPFCVAENTKTEARIDIEKFAKVMRLLKEEDRVRGVKITGGEPFYDIGLLNEVTAVLFEIFGYSLEVDISTNGTGLKDIRRIKNLEYIDTIHISRHHYDDGINRILFGSKCALGNQSAGDRLAIPDKDMLKEIIDSVSFKDIFVFSCMLLKDFINSPKEAHRFLDFAIETGASKVCFMVCSPINKFAKEQTIPYEAVIKGDDPALLFTRGFFDQEYCHCNDGIYSSEDGRIIEFYGRSTKMGRYPYSRGLVYDAGNHLRDGFGGEIIV